MAYMATRAAVEHLLLVPASRPVFSAVSFPTTGRGFGSTVVASFARRRSTGKKETIRSRRGDEEEYGPSKSVLEKDAIRSRRGGDGEEYGPSKSELEKETTRSRRCDGKEYRPSKSELEKEARSRSLLRVKRRTRSDLELDRSHWKEYTSPASNPLHVPVMLGDVLHVFRRPQIRSFVDCTLGAAGHSTALIRSHPEMRVFIGLDVDPTALGTSRCRIEQHLNAAGSSSLVSPDLSVYTFLRNFKHINSVLCDVGGKSMMLVGGVDGILMDLGMSSMQVNNSDRGFSILADGPLDMRMDPQASLTAEDILNYWPEAEVGRILREYGEENNWRLLQKKIMNARASGGLHSTTDLANLIQAMPLHSGGRHGWIKTAARVFQALRIAVNDELKTLEDSLYACFDRLSPGGRLAVISFHSLEDRIVKHTFLDIIGKIDGDGDAKEVTKQKQNVMHEEWIKGTIAGRNGIVLTKRPITPSEGEEKMNPRCRSAKLRVLEKL